MVAYTIIAGRTHRIENCRSKASHQTPGRKKLLFVGTLSNSWGPKLPKSSLLPQGQKPSKGFLISLQMSKRYQFMKFFGFFFELLSLEWLKVILPAIGFDLNLLDEPACPHDSRARLISSDFSHPHIDD